MILGGSYLQGLLLLFPLQHLPGGPSPSLDRRLSATAGGTVLSRPIDRVRTDTGTAERKRRAHASEATTTSLFKWEWPRPSGEWKKMMLRAKTERDAEKSPITMTSEAA